MSYYQSVEELQKPEVEASSSTREQNAQPPHWDLISQTQTMPCYFEPFFFKCLAFPFDEIVELISFFSSPVLGPALPAALGIFPSPFLSNSTQTWREWLTYHTFEPLHPGGEGFGDRSLPTTPPFKKLNKQRHLQPWCWLLVRYYIKLPFRRQQFQYMSPSALKRGAVFVHLSQHETVTSGEGPEQWTDRLAGRTTTNPNFLHNFFLCWQAIRSCTEIVRVGNTVVLLTLINKDNVKREKWKFSVVLSPACEIVCVGTRVWEYVTIEFLLIQSKFLFISALWKNFEMWGGYHLSILQLENLTEAYTFLGKQPTNQNK